MLRAASDEQALGVEQINRAMGQVDEVAQRNASSAEELASTAQEMAFQADLLRRAMDFFRLDVDVPTTERTRSTVGTLESSAPAWAPLPRGAQGGPPRRESEALDPNFERF